MQFCLQKVFGATPSQTLQYGAQKRLKYVKKYFTGLFNVLRCSFIPTKPLLATMSFFFPFFF